MKTGIYYFNLISLFLLCFFVQSFATAQEIKLNQSINDIRIIENSYSKLTCEVSISKLKHFSVNTVKSAFEELSIDNYGYSDVLGFPKLPVLKKLIEVPIVATYSIRIINSSWKEYTLSALGILNPIIPAQPGVSKNPQIPLPDFKKNEAIYKTNAYYSPQQLIKIEEVGMMRGIRLSRLEVAPVEYNPVTKSIRICEKLEVEILFDGANISETVKQKKEKYSPYFEAANHSLFNYKTESTKETITRYPVKYVIVADTMFRNTLQPFIQWKQKKGFNVVEAYTDNPLVGATSASIKNYLKGLYLAGTNSNPAPSFILLVGDVNLIPAFTGTTTSSHVTDLFYAEYTNDFIPDVYYGRFSATTVNELQSQLDKTLMYEKYEFPDPAFLGESVMIAGVDNNYSQNWANGQINYGTANYFNAQHAIFSHTYLYPSSASGSAAIIQNVSNGVGFVNYTAHGDWDKWVNPSFAIGNITSLQNSGKYPLMIGNCCLSAKFNQPECFGEALMRAANKGAVGYIGATNNTEWNEDYYWGVGYSAITPNPTFSGKGLGAYDRAFHDHGEPYADWFVTQGQMVVAGNLAVTESGSQKAHYYWEVYHLLGDPSLMIYYSIPSEINAFYNPIIQLNDSVFRIQTEPYAYVALSSNNFLRGAALADSNGFANFNILPFTTNDSADMVVTHQNKIPYIKRIPVLNPQSAYILKKNIKINDFSGNNNGKADYNETVNLDVTLENIGAAAAQSLSVILRSRDTLVQIIDSTENITIINIHDSTLVNSAFTFKSTNFIPDGHTVYFNLLISDNAGHSWSSVFSIVLNAPKLTVAEIIIDDSVLGNNNGRFDLGETANLIIRTANTGHATIAGVSGVLSSSEASLILNNTNYYIDTLSNLQIKSAVYSVTISNTALNASNIEFQYHVASGDYQANKNFTKVIGLVDENFESGSFAHYNWNFGGNFPWLIDTLKRFEGLYAARSDTVGNNQSSELSIVLNVASEDSITFYRKISSEQDYDFLKFMIDNITMYAWSGERDWAQVSFPVTAGNHTFKWVYYKDAHTAIGSDCAWVDNIIFPPIVPLSVNNVANDIRNFSFSVEPNPMKEKGVISFELAEKTIVSVDLFDATGNKIKRLMNDAMFERGRQSIDVDTKELSSGIYFCILNNMKSVYSRKFILIKN